MLNKTFMRLVAIVLILSTALPAMAGCNPLDTANRFFDKLRGVETETPTENIPDIPEAPTEPPYDPEKITEYALNSESPVLVTGRTVELSEGLALDLSASTVRFRTRRAGDVSLRGTVGGECELYFTVYVDNVRVCDRIMFPVGESTQVIAENLSDQNHTIEIVRQTEGQYGTFTAERLIMKGSTLGEKPAERDHYIEFIGDSITCGSGVLCKYIRRNDLTHYLPTQTGDCLYDIGYGQWKEEDVTNSYAYLTARALRADCSFISYSAIGLMRSWMNLGFNAQDLYRRGAYLREGGDVYDFSTARKPDLVVINLGTNDIGLMNGGQGGYVGKITDAQYKQAVKNFINQIRASYNDPDLKIVWAVGLMGLATYSLAQEAIREMNDENLYTYRFSSAMDGHRDHPCMKQSVQAASAFRFYLDREGILK